MPRVARRGGSLYVLTGKLEDVREKLGLKAVRDQAKGCGGGCMRKHIIAISFIPIALMILCGCAPPTANVVRGLGSKSQYIFEVGDNYQPVYDKIYTQAKKCLEVSIFSADIIVFGKLNNETKFGSVEVVLYGALDADTYQVIDIYDIDDNNALIIAYYSLDQANKYGPVLKEWVLDNSAECGPKKK